MLCHLSMTNPCASFGQRINSACASRQECDDWYGIELDRPVNIAGALSRLGRCSRALIALRLHRSQLVLCETELNTPASINSDFFACFALPPIDAKRRSVSTRSTFTGDPDSPGSSFPPNPAVPGRMCKLEFQDPVPSDIDIAQSVTPTPIADIAKKFQISAEDFEPHGTTKAKVGARHVI